MKNVIPRYKSLASRKKNKINVTDLFFLNIQSDRSKKVKPGTLSVDLIDKVKTILSTDENQDLIRNAFGNEKERQNLDRKSKKSLPIHLLLRITSSTWSQNVQMKLRKSSLKN